MRLIGLVRAVVVALVLAVVLTACHRAPVTTQGGLGGPVGPVGPVGPMNDKERMHAEAWARATVGLDFDSRNDEVVVQKIFAGDPVRAAEHLAEGHDLLGTNRIMDALEQYGLAARHDPDLSDAYVGIGRVLVRKGKLGIAIKSLRTAVDRDRESTSARYELAMAMWAADRKADAIAEMNGVLELDADDAAAHERLAVWRYYAGEYAAAWDHLHRAEALGASVPAQLPSLLARHMPDPGGAD